MKRFEKIVLEQITSKSKLGDWGIINDNWKSINPKLTDISKKLVNDESIDVVSFVWWVINEGTSFKTVASNLGQSRQYGKNSQFNTGKYIYVIDEKIDGEKRKRKPIEYFPVYIVPVTTSDIPKSTYNIGTSPVVSMQQYTKWKASAEAKEKADAEAAAIAAAEKKKPEVKKPEVVVQNVINGTETIDTNNLGKGTADAKAFQELLWQYGNKYETQKNLPVYTEFASYRTRGADGGWDGDIGPATKKYITFLYAGLKVNTYPELIKKIRSDLSQVQTESTNYFKGIGMNIKLKGILREQLLKEQEGFDFSAANAAIGSGATTTSTTKKKTKTNKIYTQATLPLGNVSGILKYDNGDTFEGSWKDKKKQGQGTYTWLNGDKHIGEWKDGKRHGPGIHIIGTGDFPKTYTGEWSNGKKNGEFKIKWPNGDIRVGTFINDVFGGLVKFTPNGGETVEETWKDNELLKSNATYWSIAKDWVIAEYKFWQYEGTGPKGQKRPVSHNDMFDQFNGAWYEDDNEEDAKEAYLANRKIALQWLDKELAGCIAVTGYDYYGKIEKWIYDIADEIDDVFQNDQTIKLTNDAEGDTIIRTVQGEIDT